MMFNYSKDELMERSSKVREQVIQNDESLLEFIVFEYQ